MKKGLLIMALILGMVLTLALFSRNKAEAYYGGNGTYNSLSGGYGAYSSLSGGYSVYGSLSGGYGTYDSLPGGYGTYNSLSGGYGTYGSLYSNYATLGSLPGGYATLGGISSGFGQVTGYGSMPAGYGGMIPRSTEEGVIIVPARVNEPISPGPGPGLEIFSPVSNPMQNTPWPGQINILPTIISTQGTGLLTYPGFITYPQPVNMPLLEISPLTYPVSTVGPEQLWSNFPAIPSSPQIFPLTPAFPPNPYWPDVYPTILPPTFPGNIPILM